MKKALAAVTTAAACFAPTLVSAQAAAAKPEPEYTFTGNLTIGATIASAASRRPITSRQSRAASTSRTSLASILATGTRTFRRASSTARRSRWTSTADGSIRSATSVSISVSSTTTTRAPGKRPLRGQELRGIHRRLVGTDSLKYFYAFTDFFGVEAPGYNTKGSQYVDFSGNYPIGGGWRSSRTPAGKKNYENINRTLNKDNVWDYKLGGTWDIAGSGWFVGASGSAPARRSYFRPLKSAAGRRQERLPCYAQQDVLSTTTGFEA